MDYAKEALKMHREWRGKLSTIPKMTIKDKNDLSIAYTPGVAQPCLEIQKDVNKSYELTRRWNTVAVVTDGVTQLTAYGQINLANLISSQLPDAAANIDGWINVNYNFLGLNLATNPWDAVTHFTFSWATIGLILIPIIAGGSQLLMTKFMTRTQPTPEGPGAGSTKMMLWFMPLFSVYIAFIMPAALGLYWIAQNLLSMVQEFICGKLLKKDYEKAAAARAEQERLEKEEEKEERRRKAEERARRIEEAKLNKGKKKKTEKKHDEDEDKIPGSVKEHSRVGLRQYARGRAYDPYRYSEEGPTAYPGEAPIFPPRSDSRALKREAHEIEEELREIHTDEAIEDAILEEKALEAPVQEETEVVSAGEESEAEDDTDKTKE